jgi:hypothetical protein
MTIAEGGGLGSVLLGVADIGYGEGSAAVRSWDFSERCALLFAGTSRTNCPRQSSLG